MIAPAPPIRHVAHGHRGAFVVERGDRRLAELAYTLAGEIAILEHTAVDSSLRGTGAGTRLVEAAVAWARGEGMRIVALCPFSKSVFDRRLDLRDVLA